MRRVTFKELEPISMKLAYYMQRNLAANLKNLVNVALATLPQLFEIFTLDFFAFTTALSVRQVLFQVRIFRAE
jgi:hypothetical protein